VVIARVRDEVLYTFFAAPTKPLCNCQTLVLANVRPAPRPLRCPLVGTLLLAAAWPLVGSKRIQSRTLVSGIGFTPPPLVPSPVLIIVSLFVAISPARTRIQLRHCFAFGSPRSRVREVVRYLAPHRHSSSSLSPRLLSHFLFSFFQGKCCAYPFGKKKGRLNIHFAPFDFYKSHLTIRLIQKFVKM
jgi:hypothetical protein